MPRACLLALFFLSPFSSIAAQDERIEVPTLEEQATASSANRKVHVAAYAQSDLDGRKSLFLLLMQKAGEESKDVLRFVLLQEARRIALAIPSVPHAVMASKKLASQFKLEPFALMQDTLAKLADVVEDTGSYRALSVAYRALAKQTLLDGEIKVTDVLLRRSLDCASRSKAEDELWDSRSVQEQFLEVRRLFDAAAVARARLVTDPVDPEANSTLGTYLCFVIGDWKRGLIFLSRAAEAECRQQAFRDASGSERTPMQISIAEGWRKIASKQRGPLSDLKKAQIVRRARVWLHRALQQSSGVDRELVGALLDALGEYKRDSLLEPAKRRWFVLFRSSDPNLWNRSANEGKNSFALPLRYAPKGLHYLRLRLVDEDKSIIIRMKKQYLSKVITMKTYGWNGTSGLQYGARHLGIFDTSRHGKPGAVEINFAVQGWGFGHLYDVEKQAGAWDGRPMKAKTVFEIAVTEQSLLPKEKERLLH